MTAHPVRFDVPASEPRERIHVLIRLALLAAVGVLGCSSIYWVLYLTVPVCAALLIAQHGAPRYLAEDAPHLVRTIRWVASAYAYAWLLTDRWPPAGAPDAWPVVCEIHASGSPTAGSALLRLAYSAPAVILLALLSMAARVLWVFGAVTILVARRLPPAIADFLTSTLRFQFRLLAYHLSLVERYPSLDPSLAAGTAHGEAA